jgi:hypothetical protein
MNHPIIVIDGPDGVGKTTLAKELVAKLGGAYIHCGYRFTDKIDLYHSAALELALTHDQPVIMDRWWVSEVVYAKAFRGGTPWPWFQFMLDRAALKHGVTYVICQDEDKERYLKHFEKLKGYRDEMFDCMGEIHDLYEAWMGLYRYHPTSLCYDYHKPGPNAADLIAGWAYRNIAALPQFARDAKDRRFAGNPYAKTIMVGDSSNPKGRRQVWPFFDYGYSSLWITRAISGIGVMEHDLGWLNINGQGGKLQWHEDELGWFDDATFVAMGANAQRALADLELPHEKVPHPQWYNRFQHNETHPDRLVEVFTRQGIIKDDAAYRHQLGLAEDADSIIPTRPASVTSIKAM